MLLVILGAGASFDSVSDAPPGKAGRHEPFRPPLADQLFENRPLFVDAMRRFSRFMPLVPLLRKPGVIVEQELGRFLEEAKTSPERQKQLAAIRYYLEFALLECQTRWWDLHKGTTNFASLLEEIEQWRFETRQKVCLVTFNYDTILEEAMSQILGINFTEIRNYVLDPNYILVKLHGSVNWGRMVEEYPSPIHSWNQEQMIEYSAGLPVGKGYMVARNRPLLIEEGQLVVPAIAIPVQKKNEFVCPEEHVLALNEVLPEVTKIITIGWRATEAEFLTKLSSKLTRRPQLMVVSGDDAGAKETQRNLGASTMMAETNGFTGLVNRLNQLAAFLRS